MFIIFYGLMFLFAGLEFMFIYDLVRDIQKDLYWSAAYNAASAGANLIAYIDIASHYIKGTWNANV